MDAAARFTPDGFEPDLLDAHRGQSCAMSVSSLG
jgi:hypothetical protein